MSSTDTVALIVAAGKGERAGGDVPKQFQLLGGLPLVEHARRAFAAHPRIDRVVTVLGDGQSAAGETVTGGAARRDSVRNGLEAIGDATRVLIHDAARPIVPADVIDRLLLALDTSKGAVPTLAVADTLATTGDALGDVV